MVLKRSLAEAVNDNSHASAHNQNVGHKIRKQEGFIQEIVARVEPIIRRVVRQELEAALGPLQSSQRGSHVNQPKSPTSRTLQLTFANKPRSTFFTNCKIFAEGHGRSFVTIQLTDANSGEVISYAPFGSMGVEIFVIHGDFIADGQEDWSNKALDRVIVREREGRRPLLVGERSFSLINGVALMKNVIFTDNSSWVRSRRFRLGVRAVPNTLNGVRIKEGISEAFVVLEHRGESYQKRDKPFLNDPLWRLKKISKNGAICSKLAENGIHTVKDFLRLYHVNPKDLRLIVGNRIANKTWESIVKHANGCCLDNTLYTYNHAAVGVGLLLNSVYKVLRVTFDGINYQTVDALNMQQMVLVEELQNYIYWNPNVLCPTNGSSTYPSNSSQLQINDPVCGPSLDPWDNGTQITDQGNLLDLSHSDPSGTNPYMTDGSHHLEEDITTYFSQQIESRWGSSSQPINQAYGWDSINTMPLIMDQNFVPQPSIFHPVVTTWATASANNAQFSSPLQSLEINFPSGGKSKARWVKIRALLMWKIVKRDAAAKKKGKFPLEYWQSQFA